MAFTEKQLQEINAAGERFLRSRRPPAEIRHQLDLACRIEGQSVLVYEIRPHWQNLAETTEEPVAKTTFVGTQGIWKVYWMRADLKWHSYAPKVAVKTIKEFFDLVSEDAHCCFFG